MEARRAVVIPVPFMAKRLASVPSAIIFKSVSSVAILDQLRSLPPAERREIVEKIWDEFADRDLALTPAQAVELDRRLADHQANPHDVESWEEMKAATEAKYRRQ